MTRTSLAIFILIELFLATGAPKLPHGPTITKVERYKVENCKDDPLSPCEGERLTIVNPWFQPATVTLTCSADDETEVQLPPRTSLTVEVDLSMPVAYPACRIKSSRK